MLRGHPKMCLAHLDEEIVVGSPLSRRSRGPVHLLSCRQGLGGGAAVGALAGPWLPTRTRGAPRSLPSRGLCPLRIPSGRRRAVAFPSALSTRAPISSFPVSGIPCEWAHVSISVVLDSLSLYALKVPSDLSVVQNKTSPSHPESGIKGLADCNRAL